MDTYLLIKTLHILAVIIWLGGDFACLVLSVRCERNGDTAAGIALLPDIMFITRTLVVPSSLVALLCGLAMVWMAWDFAQLWVWIGLAGLATVLVGGVAFLKPRTERLMALAATEGPTAEVATRHGAILRIVKFDHLIMFVVVADMVLKPGFGDDAVWLALAALLAAGAGLIFLTPARPMQSA